MKTTQKGTEGILNKVSNKYDCTRKRNTIAVQNLIRFHKPKTKTKLVELIDSHHKDNKKCECGCVANGNLDTWSQRLYDSYLKYTEVVKELPEKNLEDCKIYMNYLFVEGSIKGGVMEKEALKILKRSKLIKDFDMIVRMGSEKHDFKYAVDIVLYDKDKNEVMGLQVKPNTYKRFNSDSVIVMTNINKNKSYNKPVLYIYYDKNGDFVKSGTFKTDLNRILQTYTINNTLQLTH